MNKGQGALEYLLLIGGAILVAVIVVAILVGLDNGQNSQEEPENLKNYCNAQEEFYLKYANRFEWDNTPEFCLALREYLIECSSSEHIEVRKVYDDRCLLQRGIVPCDEGEFYNAKQRECIG